MHVTADLSKPAQQAAPAVRPPAPRNRLGFRFVNQLTAWFGLPWERRLARAALYVPRIRRWEAEFDRLDDNGLASAGKRLRGRAHGGENLDRLLAEAFGLVCVAAKRYVGLRPFDVQLAGGVVMHFGGLAEVATGEGKTLVAALPAFLNALAGKGAHVTTVNDYLARRDAEWMGPVYSRPGPDRRRAPAADGRPGTRRAAYSCDITYGTASEFGFDFLRDRLKVAGDQGPGNAVLGRLAARASRRRRSTDVGSSAAHHYALVDEADNIFIDEARTPLIISHATRPATPEEQRRLPLGRTSWPGR